MNRLTALALTTLAFAPAAALADQPLQVTVVEAPMPDRDNRVSLNPIGALIGLGSFTYERALGDRVGLTLSPSFMYLGFSENKVYGAGFGVGAAFYITGTAPEGFRFSVDAAPGFVTAESGSSDATAFMFNSRAMLGYNWVWHSGFTLGLNAGVQYLHMGLEDADVSINGVLPAIDFNLGFVF
jgi:hypothetical protein